MVPLKDIYYAKYGDHATNRVNSVWHGVNGIRKDNTKYSYDKAGNISAVTENGIESAKYVYDGLNRLIRENTADFGKITYEYDNVGNILCKAVDGKRYKYTYSQNGWKDQLLERSYKEYDGKIVHEYFKYDVIGNPVVYRNRTLSWQGRRLLRYGNNEYYAEYTYDVDGVRTSRHAVTPVGTVDSKYIYDGNNLVAEQRNGEWLYYLYGVDGVAGFRYNNETYIYRKNVQGDITHIYKQEENDSLTQVAHYVYDAWGNCKILHNIDGIATFNSFRYRSYYFDEETGLYYLQSRYYDPELGRFISADSIEYLDPESLGGLNLYAYCGNNPVMFFDYSGNKKREWWEYLFAGFLVVAVVTLFVVAAIATGGTAGVVLMSIGIGVAFGAADGAYNAYQNGTDIIGGMFSGAIKGGAAGLALGLGIAAGAAGLGIVWGIAAATVSVSANILAGVAAYNVECKHNGWEIDPSEQLKSGLMQGASGLLSFFAGSIIGSSGIYNVPGKYNSAGVIKTAYEKLFQVQWISNFIFGQIIKNLVNLPLIIIEFLKNRKLR